MIEAHVVNSKNRHLYEREFDEFLRRRHDHYAVANRWVPVSDDGLELDPFDTDEATYLLGMEDSQVVTSARLMPTTVPNLVSEEFPDMCEHIGVPCSPQWADWTRTYVLPDLRGVGARGTLGQMFCAVMEYCLDEGITHVGGVLQQYLVPRWMELGWRVIPAGLPRKLSGDWCLVAYVRSTRNRLHGVAMWQASIGPCLFAAARKRPSTCRKRGGRSDGQATPGRRGPGARSSSAGKCGSVPEDAGEMHEECLYFGAHFEAYLVAHVMLQLAGGDNPQPVAN